MHQVGHLHIITWILFRFHHNLTKTCNFETCIHIRLKITYFSLHWLSGPFLRLGLPDLVPPTFPKFSCRLPVRKRSTHSKTVTFRAGHSLTATCITLLQTQVSVWTHRHHLRQILLRWDHLRLYMYIFLRSAHIEGHMWLFNFFWKAKRTFLCASPLFNMKVPGHFAPVMRCFVTCSHHKVHRTKRIESREAHVLYSRLQLIYCLCVSKKVTHVCRFLPISVNLMYEKVGFRW